MNEEETRQLCAQLHTIDTSLAFLVLLILSVCLSWLATAIQRGGLCKLLQGRAEEVPDVFPIRLTAGAIVVGALTYFFSLALDTWRQAGTQDETARASAQRDLWAALFVLAAGLIRLYDLVYLQGIQPALEEELLPG